MNRPIYEVFVNGVEITAWENETEYTTQEGIKGTRKYLTIKVKEVYRDRQGLPKSREALKLDSVPNVILGLHKLYNDLKVRVTTDNRELKDNL